MRPLAELREPQRIRGLLFDIDDTLTTEGKASADHKGGGAMTISAGIVSIN